MADETNHYETLFIVHPVHAGRNQELCERYRGVLEGRDATVTHFEEWGMRDLAYPIQKQGKGFYNLVQYEASAGTSEELERLMRLSDEVMRCMTVVLDDDVVPLAQAEAPAPAPAAAPETSAAAEPAPAPEAAAAPEAPVAAEPAPATEDVPATEPAPAPTAEPAPEAAEEKQEGSEA